MAANVGLFLVPLGRGRGHGSGGWWVASEEESKYCNSEAERDEEPSRAKNGKMIFNRGLELIEAQQAQPLSTSSATSNSSNRLKL